MLLFKTITVIDDQRDMGYFGTFDLHVVDNENFRTVLPHGNRSRSPEFVQGSQFGPAVHVPMLHKAQAMVV